MQFVFDLSGSLGRNFGIVGLCKKSLKGFVHNKGLNFCDHCTSKTADDADWSGAWKCSVSVHGINMGVLADIMSHAVSRCICHSFLRTSFQSSTKVQLFKTVVRIQNLEVQNVSHWILIQFEIIINLNVPCSIWGAAVIFFVHSNQQPGKLQRRKRKMKLAPKFENFFRNGWISLESSKKVDFSAM